jgi:hypothetical protein
MRFEHLAAVVASLMHPVDLLLQSTPDLRLVGEGDARRCTTTTAVQLVPRSLLPRDCGTVALAPERDSPLGSHALVLCVGVRL